MPTQKVIARLLPRRFPREGKPSGWSKLQTREDDLDCGDQAGSRETAVSAKMEGLTTRLAWHDIANLSTYTGPTCPTTGALLRSRQCTERHATPNAVALPQTISLRSHPYAPRIHVVNMAGPNRSRACSRLRATSCRTRDSANRACSGAPITRSNCLHHPSTAPSHAESAACTRVSSPCISMTQHCPAVFTCAPRPASSASHCSRAATVAMAASLQPGEKSGCDIRVCTACPAARSWLQASSPIMSAMATVTRRSLLSAASVTWACSNSANCSRSATPDSPASLWWTRACSCPLRIGCTAFAPVSTTRCRNGWQLRATIIACKAVRNTGSCLASDSRTAWSSMLNARSYCVVSSHSNQAFRTVCPHT